jgi:hypothetical protein
MKNFLSQILSSLKIPGVNQGQQSSIKLSGVSNFSNSSQDLTDVTTSNNSQNFDRSKNIHVELGKCWYYAR